MKSLSLVQIPKYDLSYIGCLPQEQDERNPHFVDLV
jgi:hypothetical protein